MKTIRPVSMILLSLLLISGQAFCKEKPVDLLENAGLKPPREASLNREQRIAQAEKNTTETDTGELGMSNVGHPKVGPAQIRPTQIRPAQASVIHPRPGQVGSAQIGALKLGIDQVHAREVGSA